MNKNKTILKTTSLVLYSAIFIMISGFSLTIFTAFKNNDFTYNYLMNLQSMKIVSVGLCLIMSIPMIRILMELFFFIKEKNYVYILITTVLIINIIISIYC